MAGSKNNKSAEGVKADPNAWMITFGDLLMLLLTFFVLLLTMKSMDGGRLKEVFNQFLETHGPLEYNDTSGKPNAIEIGDHYAKPMQIQSSAMLRELISMLHDIEQITDKQDEVKNLNDILDITEDDRGVIVTLACDDLFARGSADLKPDRVDILDKVGDLLRYATNEILIMGHTDDMPVNPSAFDSNLQLSFYRALSAFQYMTDNLDFRPDRMAVGGYGQLRPQYPNDSEANRAKNRRVEFILRKLT
ncbi:MAG: OmpA family protein [Desulfobacterales bacterium]|nr:OmpA family protein [Desulfobacterales bacterium]